MESPAREWVDLETLGRAAERLRTIAHPHRLRMIEMLLVSRFTVGELAKACGIKSHMASEHLRLMQRSGLLSFERDGRKTYYSVCEPQLARLFACATTGLATGPVSSPVTTAPDGLPRALSPSVPGAPLADESPEEGDPPDEHESRRDNA